MKQNNNIKALLIAFALGFLILAVILTNAPKLLCSKWGGVLYNDGQCYFTNDLEVCIDTDTNTIYDINNNHWEGWNNDEII